MWQWLALDIRVTTADILPFASETFDFKFDILKIFFIFNIHIKIFILKILRHWLLNKTLKHTIEGVIALPSNPLRSCNSWRRVKFCNICIYIFVRECLKKLHYCYICPISFSFFPLLIFRHLTRYCHTFHHWHACPWTLYSETSFSIQGNCISKNAAQRWGLSKPWVPMIFSSTFRIYFIVVV